MKSLTHDCIIIGGGPAGLSAAIYLQRFHRKTLIVDNDQARIKMAPRIWNLPGYNKGIPGKNLLLKMRGQARQFKAEFKKGEATIFRHGRIFEIKVGNESFFSKFVILATGAKDIQPKHVDYTDLCEKKVVAYCPICDGFDHTNKKMGVLINSQSCLAKVMFLSQYSKKLHVLMTKPVSISTRRKNKMQEQGIQIHGQLLEKMSHVKQGNKVRIQLKGKKPFVLDLVYIELGLKVSNKAVKHVHGIKMKSGRYLMNRHQQISIPGLYAIGDCANSLAQVSVAAGEAAIAATDVHNQLSKLMK